MKKEFWERCTQIIFGILVVVFLVWVWTFKWEKKPEGLLTSNSFAFAIPIREQDANFTAIPTDALLKAAEKGYANAQYNLGLCYYNGLGVERDVEKAVKLWQQAAEQRSIEALIHLRYCYENGIGVPKSIEEAVKWYGKVGAVKALTKIAEQGNAAAQYALAVYYEGIGVPKSFEEAVKWYRKVAEQEHPEVQYKLGEWYYYGKGVAEDDAEAVKWYTKAAEQGYALAQYKLGWCYEFGLGVATDKKEAVKWYKKSAKQGFATAKNALKRLEINE